jgi:hypothetical protein
MAEGERIRTSDTVARMTHQDARCLKPLSRPSGKSESLKPNEAAEALCNASQCGTRLW